MRISIKSAVVMIVFIVSATLVGVSIAIWAFNHLNVRVPLGQQQLQIALDKDIDAAVKLEKPLDVSVQGVIDTVVPVKENLNIPVTQTLNPRVYIDSEVPIKSVIPVKQNLQIDQILAVDTTVQVKIFGQQLNLPLKGDIPVRMQVPLDIQVPIDQKIHLKFDSNVKTVLKENLHIPIDEKIKAKIPINGDLTVPIKTPLAAQVEIKNGMAVTVQKGELYLPVNTLQIMLNNKTTQDK